VSTREEHIERFRTAWEPIRDAVGTMDDAAFAIATPSNWSAKEMLGHLALRRSRSETGS